MTERELEFYRENGYVLLRGVLTPEECASMRGELHDLADRLSQKRSIDATWGSGREAVKGATKTVIKHCHDVQFHIASMAKLLTDDRLTTPASQIIGPNVQLHHTKMFIKPPENGSPFPMHQDQPFFPHDQDSMIAAIVHFDDAPIEKGCVRVVPGSHQLGALQHLPEGSWHLPYEEYPVEDATPCPAKAGDILFFSYLTIHGSGINTSDDSRTTVLIQLRDPADPPTIRTHESRGQGMILHGIDPLTVDLESISNGSTGAMGEAMAPAMDASMNGAMNGGMGKM